MARPNITTEHPRRVTRPFGMTPQQQLFVHEWLKHRDGQKAAIEVGIVPSRAGARAAQWLNPSAHPEIALYVQQKLEELEERALMKAEDVQRYIATVMKYEPFKYFSQSDGNGGWLLTLDELRALPSHIGCLVESFDVTEVTTGEGPDAVTKKYAKVKLISKTKAMELMAKHMLGEKVFGVNVNVDGNTFDWDRFFGRPEPHDPVQKALEKEGERKEIPGAIYNKDYVGEEAKGDNEH